MVKRVRTLVACVMALLMALAMCGVVFAATVENDTNHTYNAYQVFSGTQETDGVPLGDVEWGTGVDGDTFLTALKADSRFVESDVNVFASCASALDVAAVMGNYSDNSAVAQAFANVAAQHLTGISTAIGASGTYELSAGYYLLVDTSTLAQGDAYNSALLQVTNKGNVKIAKKYDVPSVDKSVKDSDGTWGEAADWEVGSSVPFVLTGTLPTNYADYETYAYTFHDTPCAALKYNDDAKVYVQNGETKTDVTSSFTVSEADGELTVSCADLKAVAGVDASSKIVVEYTATLQASAVIGRPGNSNKVYLEFSNNPNQTGTGTTGKTPEDETLVFAYKLDVTKVDGKDAGKKLANAEFVLLNADKTKVAQVENGVFAGWADVPAAGSDGAVAWPVNAVLTSDGDGTFSVAGLDAGSYYLRETKAPAGYNLLKHDISATISATLDKDENSPALTELKLTVVSDEAGAEPTVSDGDLTTGTVSTNVVNNSGAELPETGGMGTTVFYVVGGILVVGAVVVLVARRRVNANRK